MKTLTFTTLNDKSASLETDALDRFASEMHGDIITPADAEYDTLRVLWNAMIDRRPALIARCHDADDVCTAINFARNSNMLFSVRGGGHHIAGNAAVDNGMMIDLSLMRSVHIDADTRRARVGPGALLGDVDRASQSFGLATPLGINSTTGVAGLCLGGGFGWLTRKYGLTVDNLMSADLVTAEGRLITVSASQHPELFWAIRGGGGNFGVVTSFELQLHPVGPELYSGLVVYEFKEARQVLRAWRDFNRNTPDELAVWAVLRKAPPLPFLPESAHGSDVVILPVVYSGEPADGERHAAPVMEFGTPLGHHLGVQPYADFQAAFDPLLIEGARNYWKSHDFSDLTNPVIDELIAAAADLPGEECEIFMAQLGGAMGRVDRTATAYTGRDAKYVVNLHGRWQHEASDEAGRTWARAAFDALTPHATGGGYVNFLTGDEAGRVALAYGVNYRRLQAIKHRYDPQNLFRINQNIKPSADRMADLTCSDL